MSARRHRRYSSCARRDLLNTARLPRARDDRQTSNILAVLIGGDGPVPSETWPGIITDGDDPDLVDRLRSRFAIADVKILADRRMINAETPAALDAGFSIVRGRTVHVHDATCGIVAVEPLRRRVLAPQARSSF